jgi:hypothetical protein
MANAMFLSGLCKFCIMSENIRYLDSLQKDVPWSLNGWRISVALQNT